QLFQHAGRGVVEDQERVAGDRTGENLMNRRDLVRHDHLQRFAQIRDRMHGDLRHLEQHAMSGQLGQGCRSPTETDVEQLDERVLLDLRQLHPTPFFVVLSTISRICAGSIGLQRKPAAPAASTISREEVWTSAVTTMTRAPGSSCRSFSSTSRPYIPFITRSSSTTSGFSIE